MSTTKLLTASILMMVAATALAAGRGLANGPQLLLGEQRRWALDFRTRLEQSGSKRPIEINLSGDWLSTVTAVRSGEYDVELEFANVHLSGNRVGNPGTDAVKQVELRLGQRFWASYRDNGELLVVHFFKDTDPGDRNLLQMIATAAQVVRPETRKMVWNTQERDGGGSYLAIYNYADTNAIMKRKLKYVHTDAEPGAPTDALRLDVEKSEFRFTLDTAGEINTLEGSERVRIGVAAADNQFTVIMNIRLSDPRKMRAPELIGGLERSRSEVVSSPIITHRPDPEKLMAQHDAELLEGHTTESLLAAARAEKTDDRDLSARLSAMFRRRPESIPATLDLLRQIGEQRRITGALGAAHTPAAIKALSGLALDPATPSQVRVDALTALVFDQHPSIEAMRIPVALFDDSNPQVASAGRIMGGAVAHAGRKDHSAEADVIDAALIDRYKKAHDIREVSDILVALGNSVGPAVVPVIEQALHDPRDPVRAAAARAMRLADVPETDDLLAAAISNDTEPSVRSAAIFATSFRHTTSSLAETLIKAAKTDSAESVRAEAIVQLRAHPQASPDIPASLSWIAEHDAKPGIRRLAREGLTPTQYDVRPVAHEDSKPHLEAQE